MKVLAVGCHGGAGAGGAGRDMGLYTIFATSYRSTINSKLIFKMADFTLESGLFAVEIQFIHSSAFLDPLPNTRMVSVPPSHGLL